MSFIKKKYNNISNFSKDYISILSDTLHKVDFNSLSKIVSLIEKKIKNKKTLYVCGNGGSAAISNHFVCDYLKYMKTDNNLCPKIFSLSSSNELLTAISNDISYDKIFSYQLKVLASSGDILLVISSSGNSKNLIEVIKAAKKMKIKIISFTGFDGGIIKRISDYNLHFNYKNYGISEDLHHISMHLICQYIRMKYSNKDVKKIKF
jgi:D-sedoheptulose 7-phosphate isomerase